MLKRIFEYNRIFEYFLPNIDLHIGFVDIFRIQILFEWLNIHKLFDGKNLGFQNLYYFCKFIRIFSNIPIILEYEYTNYSFQHWILVLLFSFFLNEKEMLDHDDGRCNMILTNNLGE